MTSVPAVPGARIRTFAWTSLLFGAYASGSYCVLRPEVVGACLFEDYGLMLDVGQDAISVVVRLLGATQLKTGGALWLSGLYTHFVHVRGLPPRFYPGALVSLCVAEAVQLIIVAASPLAAWVQSLLVVWGSLHLVTFLALFVSHHAELLARWWDTAGAATTAWARWAAGAAGTPGTGPGGVAVELTGGSGGSVEGVANANTVSAAIRVRPALPSVVATARRA